MKNLKRAYRRYKQHVHTKRRAKNWYFSSRNAYSSHSDGLCWADYWEKIKSGEVCTWIRHTGRPCSCSMCSQRYERPTPEVVRNIIKEQLDDIDGFEHQDES